MRKMIIWSVVLHALVIVAWCADMMEWLMLLGVLVAPVVWWMHQRKEAAADLGVWDDAKSCAPWDFRG